LDVGMCLLGAIIEKPLTDIIGLLFPKQCVKTSKQNKKPKPTA